jgi:cupin fold WbuC family metalloprotein
MAATNGDNPQVISADGEFVSLANEIVERLAAGSKLMERGRMRFCAHRSGDDPLHEMLIALVRDTYIRPHRHAGKSESVHVISGYGDLVRFDDGGHVESVLRVEPYGSSGCFYYRMAVPQYHMLIVRSDVLVVHETTNGPFRPEETEFAPWAPDETDVAGRTLFLDRLEKEIAGRDS